MSKKSSTFRIGRVTVYRRGSVWYLCYYQHGHRYRSRVGPDRKGARQLAAQVNAQLEVSAPTVLAFEPISIPDLREQWLSHHEDVIMYAPGSERTFRPSCRTRGQEVQQTGRLSVWGLSARPVWP